MLSANISVLLILRKRPQILKRDLLGSRKGGPLEVDLGYDALRLIARLVGVESFFPTTDTEAPAATFGQFGSLGHQVVA